MLVLSALFLAGLLAETEEPYAWPLNQPRALTSSFGEYRTDRFHMGIDLRTGPIGKAVFAAESGYVARVRCSPFGYGKVVYVQLDDGNMAIYAHLSDFMPELRRFVRRAQHDRKNYTVDLYPDPGAFRVERGQEIAKSGQTGIGVPHLHWEIRNSAGVPVNPRLLGMSWPDSSAPRVRSVLLIPTTPDTRINGDYLPVVVPMRRKGTDGYVADSVRVRGSVALGIDVYDPANGGASKLGVHRIVTRVDGELVFEMVHDEIGYDHAGDGVVAYHPYFRNRGKFLMQWAWPGVATELYRSEGGDGKILVEDEPRSVVVEATDFFDRSVRATILLESDVDASVTTVGDTSSGVGRVFYDSVGDWLVITVAFSDAEDTIPVLLESGSPSTLERRWACA